jgi:DNA-binding CsgD family transcriptional regulator
MLEQAVAVLEQTEGRLDHALALIELGALLRRSGSRGAAREPLRAGMDLAARYGATALADRAHAELVAAGARPRRDRRFLTGSESLTAGEFRVAALAAEGLTDRQIAQRLYVTQAAVQFHLRNTFRKLDIRARGDLARVLNLPVSETKP